MPSDLAATSTEAASSKAPKVDVPGGGGEPTAHGADQSRGMPILKEDGWVRYPSVTERYFTTHTLSNHQCLHAHSNGICVLGVAPTHPMLQPPARVVSVNYRSHDAKNLMQTAVHGKRKAGAVFVTARDMVCTVEVSDDPEDPEATATFTLYGCVRGYVVEVNHRLIEHPELLGRPEGYLAVLMPKLEEKKSMLEACLEFDRQTPLAAESTNSKRKSEGKQARSAGGGADGGGGGKGKKRARANTSPCWAFTKGNCKYGESCKFSHDVSCGGGASATGDADAGEGGHAGSSNGGRAAGDADRSTADAGGSVTERSEVLDKTGDEPPRSRAQGGEPAQDGGNGPIASVATAGDAIVVELLSTGKGSSPAADAWQGRGAPDPGD